MPTDDFIKTIIEDYERDILGRRYTLVLSDGVTLSFSITPEDVPHLMGVRKLPLRQVQNKSAAAVYNMLKDGRIQLKHIEPYKEEYKKVMSFPSVISILHCGDAVKIVKKRGTLNSSYLLYLDHSPKEIIHLGIKQDKRGAWHPESLLTQRHRRVDAYIKDQQPIQILEMFWS